MASIYSSTSNIASLALTEQAADLATIATRWLFYAKADGLYQKSPAGTALRLLTSADVSGFIGGSTGATDNALLRADGTGGSTAQGSAVTIDDSGNLGLGGAQIQNYAELTATASPSSPYDISWSAASLQEITLAQNTTFTFSNLAAGRSLTLLLIQDATGNRTVTWPSSVKWPSGSAPTLTATASGVDVITLIIRDDGSTVLGFSVLDMR